MATSLEEIEASIRDAIASGFRGNLLARGQARSIVWRDGQLPTDAPRFSPLLSYDLLSYGYSLLSHGLRLLEREGNPEVARLAFEHAAGAIEAVIAKGESDANRGFHRLVAAAAYHLGRFSARAYSLLQVSLADANLSSSEVCLAKLMLRQLDAIDEQIMAWRQSGAGSDDALTRSLAPMAIEAGDDGDQGIAEFELDRELIAALDLALTDSFLGAMGTAMLAFERGERTLLDAAVKRLGVGREGSGEFNLVPQWWCHRLAIHLLGDLWDSSFHERLPVKPLNLDTPPPAWAGLRELFIASLYKRSRSEIDLWPSQLEAAARALDLSDNMVVSLPTSAGKTRIAEICILACIASGKRIVFVTPLRALSAQTEITLQRTFRPLGKAVSSLYGSIGVSDVDKNILSDYDIIVSTPEKLDFAIRNDPSLLDNVGLVVLDEGHMIGTNEREVRYEVQIQRLLQRPDADQRRIICLSAILPTGEKLEDFAAWITRDATGGTIQSGWRPTRLRYGEVEWRGDHARLNVTVGDETPFVPQFITAKVPPKKRRVKPFPQDQRELCLATAWRLVEDGQTVLLFCPVRVSVEPFAKMIVDLNERGALPSVLAHDPSVLATALAIGAEWFRPDHPVLQCLRLGVAIHHGALPTPFRKEIERLLRDEVLKVTVSSPTLAQGLNLSATALVFHGLVRHGEVIDIAEFRNVVGRAGRAYVDLEGLVLYPMYDDKEKRRLQWSGLVKSQAGKEMESGLLRLVVTLLARMMSKIGPKASFDQLADYIANNAAWTFPKLTGEKDHITEREEKRWNDFLTSLDTAILSLLGEQDVADADIEAKLDLVLGSSLWQRRLGRRKKIAQGAIKRGLVARAKYIWSRSTPTARRGYFLSGVGLNTGLLLDAHAPKLNQLLVRANVGILLEDEEMAVEAITGFANIAFDIPPFTPKSLPLNWRDLLAAWIKGKPITVFAAGEETEVQHFVEKALIYQLPWAMEAVRVRGLAHCDHLDDGTPISEFELAYAVAAVETGTLNRSAALLMRAGFTPRAAAIKAVTEGAGEFTNLRTLRRWMRSETIVELTQKAAWPTQETHAIWEQFSRSLNPWLHQTWSRTSRTLDVEWDDGIGPPLGDPVRIRDADDSQLILSSDYMRLGRVTTPIAAQRIGLARAEVGFIDDTIELDYIGPDDI